MGAMGRHELRRNGRHRVGRDRPHRAARPQGGSGPRRRGPVVTDHRSRVAHFVIDVSDLDQGTAFWSAALDAVEEPISPASKTVYRRLRLPDAPVRILLQLTTDPKVHKERMHLDLETDDVEAEARRLEALGATRWD